MQMLSTKILVRSHSLALQGTLLVVGQGWIWPLSARNSCFKRLYLMSVDFKEDYGCDDFGRGRTVKSSSREVVATIAFFKTAIPHISQGAYRHFDKACGHLKKEESGRARPTVLMSAVPDILKEPVTQVQKQMDKLKVSLRDFWVAPHADIWPDAIPKLDSGSSNDDANQPPRANRKRDKSGQGDRKKSVKDRNQKTLEWGTQQLDELWRFHREN